VQAEAVEIAQKSNTTPLAYMLQVLNDPNTPATRRDFMASQAAPYLHARRATASPTPANGAGGCGTVKLTIVAVPRGCQFNPQTQMIVYPDGTETDAPPFVGAEPTPAIDALPAPAVASDPTPPAPLPVIEVEPSDKLAVLDAWRRKKADE
jgi:hypothetical protein